MYVEAGGLGFSTAEGNTNAVLVSVSEGRIDNMSEILTRAGGSTSPARLEASPIDIRALQANRRAFVAVRSERSAIQRQLKLAGPAAFAFGFGLGLGRGLSKSLSPCAWRSGDPEAPRASVVDKTTKLLQDVSTLLVYQEVFSKPPAKAFLKVLDCLSRKDADGRLFEYYGLFFKLMCITRLPSWKDYILEAILTCENNPFAEAAATAGNPKARWTSGAQVPATLQAAAASDLDTLQRLSVSESTLSEWVAETEVDYTPDWLIAVSNFGTETCSLFRTTANCIPESQPFKVSDHRIRSSRIGEESTSARSFELKLQKAADGVIEPGYRIVPKSEQPHGEASASSSALQVEPECHSSSSYFSRTNESLARIRARLRERIKSFSRWSDAVLLLERYHAVYGVGLIASEQFLLVRRGNFYPDKQGWTARTTEACNLRIQRDEKEMLVRNFTKHANGRSAQHVLLYGPSGVGKTWLLRSALSEVASGGDLRIVTLPSFRWPEDELGSEDGDEKGYNFPKILRQLGLRQWKLRFVLFIDDLMPSAFCKHTFNILKSAFDGNHQEWPANVLLCATSSKIRTCSVHVKFRDMEVLDLAHLFGLTCVVKLTPLNEDEYVHCVQDLLEQRRPRTSVSLETSVSSEEVAQKAKQSWAQNLGARNLRSAALFVRTLDWSLR